MTTKSEPEDVQLDVEGLARAAHEDYRLKHPEMMIVPWADTSEGSRQVSRERVESVLALLRRVSGKGAQVDSSGQGWVRVEDGLPKADERVIVCTDKGERWAARCKQFDNTSKHEKVFLPEGLHPVNAVIAHWQPLPAPPDGQRATTQGTPEGL